MKKKSIIILAVVVVLAVGIFIANSVIGAKVADSVDQQLKAMIKEQGSEIPVTITYSHVTASPITGSVTIHDYAISEPNEDVTMTGASVKLGMPLTEIFALSNDKELKSIRKMSITMETPEIKAAGIVMFEADYFRLAYDGELSLFELKNAENGILPQSRQAVAVSARGMKVNQENLQDALEALGLFDSQVSIGDALKEQFKEKSDFDFSAEFDPDKKLLTIDNFSSKTGIADMSAFGSLNFTGDSVDDFEPVSGDFTASYEMKAYEMDNPAIGKIKFGGGNMEATFDFDASKESTLIPDMPDFNLSLQTSMNGFEIELLDEMEQTMAQSGIPLSQKSIKFNEFEIDFRKQGDEMSLRKLVIDIEDFVNLEASISMESGKTTNMFGMETEEAVFKSSKIEISGLSDELKTMIEEMEENMPKPLPRKGDKIVIELSGSLSNPQIKGVTDGGS